MTVLLEYIDLQLIFSSQRSCKSDFYHICTLSHSASCKIGRVSASHITNAQKFCLICWHYADAFGFLLCPKLCWHNRRRTTGHVCKTIMQHLSVKIYNYPFFHPCFLRPHRFSQLGCFLFFFMRIHNYYNK